MQYISRYASPFGGILLAADDAGLFGLWFEGQKYFARCLQPPFEERLTAPLAAARRWLDAYFSGGRPALDVPLHFIGTPFQKDVWQALCEIPYGRTATYGEVAQTVASRRCAPVSARAVGNAVGRNAISLIVALPPRCWAQTGASRATPAASTASCAFLRWNMRTRMRCLRRAKRLRRKRKIPHAFACGILELLIRFERTTCSLRVSCSTS